MNPLKEKLGQLHGGRILDIATRQGEFLSQLSESFADFTEGIGIDLSQTNVEAARAEFGDRFKFSRMDASRLDFPDNRFDTVAMRHSLHHLADIPSTLNEMFRVLKPGGMLIICELLQSQESERPNSQRHLHHWWAEVDRYKGESHNETLTQPEILITAEPLGLIDLQSVEHREEITPDRQAEILENMLARTEQIISTLIETDAPRELVHRGEELVARFREQGYTNESVLYLFGRKPG